MASSALGGVVCSRDDETAQAVIASGEALSCEWVSNIMGESYIAPRIVCPSAPEEEQPIELSARVESIDTVPGPRAAVIPLPPPVWSGMLGLGALTIASGVRKFRRFV